MPAAKTLSAHVRDRTFRSRRHHGLLPGPVLPWPELAAFQARYAAAVNEPERRAIGVSFEQIVRSLDEKDASAVDIELASRLEAIFAMGPTVIER